MKARNGSRPRSKPLTRSRSSRWVRPVVQALHAYVPGEQPRIQGLIKLNTNENPYPPSPRVLEAVRSAVDGRLRLYPNPTAQLLREKLAKFHRCSARNVMVGNGSDEILALAVRALVEPAGRADGTATFDSDGHSGRDRSRSTVQYFTPSYSLYPVLAAGHGAHVNGVRLAEGFTLPKPDVLRSSQSWDFEAALSLITTPNAPGGRAFSTAALEDLCKRQRGVVVLDEAYVDFAEENALRLALRYPHILVARTFSKAYSLCALRIGYAVGHPDLIVALDKLRDSYNVNALGQVAALATLDDLPYYRANFRRIKDTRGRLSEQLATLGFEVLPSQANFIFVRPPFLAAPQWLEALGQRKILVRWFDAPAVRDYLRITVGTDAEAKALVKAAREVLVTVGPGRSAGGRAV
jgi:histidinol-phosphate aminotransferase